MSETVIIPNVNVELLNEQRLALVRVTDAIARLDVADGIQPDDVGLMDGLQNMLDHWSDTYAASHHAPQPPSNRKP